MGDQIPSHVTRLSMAQVITQGILNALRGQFKSVRVPQDVSLIPTTPGQISRITLDPSRVAPSFFQCLRAVNEGSCLDVACCDAGGACCGRKCRNSDGSSSFRPEAAKTTFEMRGVLPDRTHSAVEIPLMVRRNRGRLEATGARAALFDISRHVDNRCLTAGLRDSATRTGRQPIVVRRTETVRR